jgi:Kef-type K+ transport system membrane component KefB
MGLLGLALVLAVGLAGPLLAISKRARVPVVVGEILRG